MPHFSVRYFVGVIGAIVLLFSPSPAMAQTPPAAQSSEAAATLGVARMIDVKDKNVKDGSVISSGAGGALLSTIPYDGHVIGVVSRDAAIILSTNATENGVPAIATGTVYILVSSQNGAVKKGIEGLLKT